MKMGATGTRELNQRLKERFNPMHTPPLATHAHAAQAAAQGVRAGRGAVVKGVRTHDERDEKSLKQSEWYAASTAQLAAEHLLLTTLDLLLTPLDATWQVRRVDRPTRRRAAEAIHEAVEAI